MFGFRPEGRRIHDVDPIVAITPYLMPQRCDAQVFLSHDADYEPLMRYIAEKAREGHKITFMELLIASYVRGVSQVPETNRFIMNKQFYNRTELTPGSRRPSKRAARRTTPASPSSWPRPC